MKLSEMFLSQVLSMCGEKTPDMENPFFCSYDSKADVLVVPNPNDLDPAQLNDPADGERLLVPTVNLHVTYAMIEPWLNNKKHVLLVGPEASGKRYRVIN